MHLLRLTVIASGLAVLALLMWTGGCARATLTAPPTSTITLSVAPTVIPENGGVAALRAIVRLADGEFVPDGVIVSFFTTLGEVDASATTVGGIASASLRSTGTTGRATVTATSGAAESASVEVTFGALLDQLRVSFAPPSLPTGGGSATVLVTLTTDTGAGVPGRGILLAVPTPATLASAGTAIVTNAQGVATDTLNTTQTVRVAASVVGDTLTGSGTITVGASGAAAMTLIASPADLPTGGGSSELTAFVTDAGGAPLAGQLLSFKSSQGTLSTDSASTDAQGLARTTLSTTLSSLVTATVGTLTDTARITVGGTVPATYSISLSAARTSLTSKSVSGLLACDGAGGNGQLPIEVVALVVDQGARPIRGVQVSLSIEDEAGDAWDGRGGFCPSPSTTSAECCPGLGQCPTPLPTATPTPTPSPAPTPTPTPTPASACCAPVSLAEQAVATTGSDGKARFSFTVEDTDLCGCVFAGRRCSARLRASAALASAANDLVITINP